jgi:hypothetical protein
MLYTDWVQRVNERLPRKLKYKLDDPVAYEIYLQTQPDTNSSSDNRGYPETFSIRESGTDIQQYTKVSVHPYLRCCLYQTLINHATTKAFRYFTTYEIDAIKIQ